MKKIIILLILISNISFGYSLERDLKKLFTIVPITQSITIDGYMYDINMHKLLTMTMGVESNFGRDDYKGRVAKTPMQFEPTTAEHYVKVVPHLKQYIEEQLGRKLTFQDKDCVFVTYLIYMSKLQHHNQWLTKHKRYLIDTGDVEWAVYKVLYNSIKGASTYKKWAYRYNLYY